MSSLMLEFPQVKSSQTDVELSERDLDSIRSERRPQLGLSFRGGEERFRKTASRFAMSEYGSLSLSGSQMLFDGGASKNRIAEARTLRMRSESDLEATRESLALDLSLIFVDIIKFRALAGFAEDSVRIHYAALSKSEEKHRAGAAPKADVELVKARLSMAQATVESRQRQLARALERYRRYTGQHAGELEEPEFPDWALPLSIEEVSLAGNPQIRSATLGVEASEARLRLARSAFSPRFDLLVQGDSIDSARNLRQTEDASALIVVNYDLFGGGRKQAEFHKSRLDINRSRYELEDALSGAEEDFLNAWNDLVISEERIRQLEIYRDSMTSVVSAYQRQFELGQRALINVLDVENELFSARSSVEEETYNRLQAAYRALAATGSLLETIQGSNR